MALLAHVGLGNIWATIITIGSIMLAWIMIVYWCRPSILPGCALGSIVAWLDSSLCSLDWLIIVSIEVGIPDPRGVWFLFGCGVSFFPFLPLSAIP